MFTDLLKQELWQLLSLADKFKVPKVQLPVWEAVMKAATDKPGWDTPLTLLNPPVDCSCLPGVDQLIAAVCEAAEQLPSDDLDFDTALGLLKLPPDCSCPQLWKQLAAKATSMLLRKFGDLDMIWECCDLENQLASLPHALLLQLVQSDYTRVANESTVVYVILQWWDKQPQSYKDEHLEQLKQLMQQIRMQHLSQLFIGTVMMRDKTVLSCFSTSELAIACLCSDHGNMMAMQQANCPELNIYPAWTAEKRPASKRQKILEWKLPLPKLQEAVMCLKKGKAFSDIYGTWEVLQGRALQLYLQVELVPSGDNNSEQQLQLGVFLARYEWGSPDFFPGGGICRIYCKFIIIKAVADADLHSSKKPCEDVCRGPSEAGYSDGQPSWGYINMLSFKSFNQWSDVEAVLRDKGLVHADECLHIQAEILRIS